jgi:hypothetical protein
VLINEGAKARRGPTACWDECSFDRASRAQFRAAPNGASKQTQLPRPTDPWVVQWVGAAHTTISPPRLPPARGRFERPIPPTIVFSLDHESRIHRHPTLNAARTSELRVLDDGCCCFLGGEAEADMRVKDAVAAAAGDEGGAPAAGPAVVCPCAAAGELGVGGTKEVTTDAATRSRTASSAIAVAAGGRAGMVGEGCGRGVSLDSTLLKSAFLVAAGRGGRRGCSRFALSTARR